MANKLLSKKKLNMEELIMKKAFFVGALILVSSVSALATVGPPPVPEIDASSIPTILALVSGGMLLLRSKFRSK